MNLGHIRSGYQGLVLASHRHQPNAISRGVLILRRHRRTPRHVHGHEHDRESASGSADRDHAADPQASIAALLIIWLGIGETPKITVIVLALFPMMTISAMQAVSSVSRKKIQAAYSLGASNLIVFRRILLPASLPGVFTGIRLSVGVGVTTLVGAELIATNDRIAWMALSASDFLQTTVVIVDVLVLAFWDTLWNSSCAVSSHGSSIGAGRRREHPTLPMTSVCSQSGRLQRDATDREQDATASARRLSSTPSLPSQPELSKVQALHYHGVSTERRTPRLHVPGGSFVMGNDDGYPEEAPARHIHVAEFWIDAYPVTNEAFAAFVAETRHVTGAEIAPSSDAFPGVDPALLVAGSLVFRKPQAGMPAEDASSWWSFVEGASWRAPEGPGSTLHGLGRHPVVHVGYEDALAYAAWAIADLPTEAEWERAARGGLVGKQYAWGDDFLPGGVHQANTWQGHFPYLNTADDGFEATSPVGSFPPNGFGVYDMIGNVWEWTRDWYSEPPPATASGCCGSHNPQGGSAERTVDPSGGSGPFRRKVLKGGSFLCAPSYCRRYRPAARSSQTIDSSSCHIGFRCIRRKSNNC